MSGLNAILEPVWIEACAPGPIDEPVNFIASLREAEHPLRAIASIDEHSKLFEAIEQDFGFLNRLRSSRTPPDENARQKWAARVRWLIEGLARWKINTDERLAMLAALLMTARWCSGTEGIWDALKVSGNIASVELIRAAGRLISCRRIDYRNQRAPWPIWEREFAEAFEKADADSDWAQIAVQWPRLESTATHDVILEEAVRCLSSFNFEELVRSADALQQVPLVMYVAAKLTDDQRLRLALVSQSARTRFCCVHSLIAQRPLPTQLTSENQAMLSIVLTSVAAEPNEWRSWMAAFNTYPIRYPAMLQPLGVALSSISRDAAQAYIDAIRLDPLPVTKPELGQSRLLVATCLRSFAIHATSEHRKAIWEYAFERWRRWDFRNNVGENHLLEINRSTIDFAICSYASECLDEGERNAAINVILKDLEQVELAWYATETECITEWNRLLSRLQPYAYVTASAALNGEAFQEKQVCWPLNVAKSLYRHIMFSINPASSGFAISEPDTQEKLPTASV